MVTWAKENLHTSGLGDRKVRFIVDDVVKFVEREIRRGNKYDAIIMDPPSYGRGPKGEVWQIEEKLYGLVDLCTKVLSDNPLFFYIRIYVDLNGQRGPNRIGRDIFVFSLFKNGTRASVAAA